MNFAFSAEQEELRRGARRFLEAQSSSKRVRAAMAGPDGHDAQLWARIGRELGWTSLAIPEEYGGAGLGQVELCAVMEEMGRALVCAPFFSTVCLAANAVLLAGTEAQRREYLPGIAAGETIATLAWADDGTTARRQDGHGHGHGDWLLTGTKAQVIDGCAASLLIVAARSNEGLGLFAVPATAGGVTRRALGTMDRTRRLAEIRLEAVRATRLGGGAPAPLGAILDRACVALAAEQVGGAERCLELAVDYAKVRVQFGRPIGSFQAVKHRCADMLVAVESARSAAYWAACLVDAGDPELPVAASLAKAVCSEAYFACAADCIQIHGGIGITWEHDAHLYFKRARASEALLGTPAFHRERVAREIGL